MTLPKAPATVLAIAALVVFAVDQLSKAVVRHELTLCSAPPVNLCDRVALPGPFGFLRTENADGAFGLLAGTAIIPVMVAVLGFLLWRLARASWTPALAAAVGLVAGGILANFADRLLFGTVTDFIDIRIGLADKGLVLNPADIGLAVGGVLLAIALNRLPMRGSSDDSGTAPATG